MRLTNKSIVELKDIIRGDPQWRSAAWAELTYRNLFRQQIERENGVVPTAPKAEVWTPPTFAPRQ